MIIIIMIVIIIICAAHNINKSVSFLVSFLVFLLHC